jgi:acetolactate synthase-1/2/3 large subunit
MCQLNFFYRLHRMTISSPVALLPHGYSRLTNGQKLPVVLVQHGPEIGNTFGAVAQAYGDNTLMRLIPGGYARDRQDVAPMFSATTSFCNVTKSVAQVNMASRILQVMHHAFS